MLELTPDNVVDYLRRRGWLGAGPAEVRPLGGGVSNAVLAVHTPQGAVVVKQSRPQLRTRDAWFSDLERVHREQAVMELLHPLLPPLSVPAVLHSDRDDFVFVMSHAPAGARVWKEDLLAGKTEGAVAEQAGRLLGRMHQATAERAAALTELRDHEVFVQLRVDPFYRRVQERRPEVAAAVGALIDQMLSVKESLCHGDFTPKNLLVHEAGLTLVDYETAHLGDPTMDLGLFLAHLLLKAVRLPQRCREYFHLVDCFWNSYAAKVSFLPRDVLQARGLAHLGACLLARIDGTSPVDYLPREIDREQVRTLGRFLLLERPARLADVLSRLEKLLQEVRAMAPNAIHRVHAREVLDSRGNPTVEVEVHSLLEGAGRVIVPSGASTGRHEAVELRDGDPRRYGGKGVRRAVAHVNEVLGPRLVGMSVADQERIARLLCEMDGTPNKSRLGANAILGVSLACAHAAAGEGLPLWCHLENAGGFQACLPLPMVNLISGGLHAGGNLDIQDVLFLPIGARSYSEALETTVAVYRALAEVLRQRGYESVLVGDEGGFGPRLPDNRTAIELATEACRRAGLNPGQDAALALDVAATHFYRDGRYHLRDQLAPLTAAEMCGVLESWVSAYPVLSIEDGMAEDDWDGWKLLTQALGRRVQLIGDDLFVTNPERLRRGIAEGVANAVLVKVNQIGTLTETLAVLALARGAGYRTVISARSGETEDTTIADLAVGTAAGQIKIGSVARSERLAKYNQLLRIEEELGPAQFATWRPLG
jgi:enolase